MKHGPMSKTFDGQMENLPAMLQFVLRQAAAPFPPDQLFRLELVTEEILVNIIQHAYQNQGGPIQIAAGFQPDRSFLLEIRDAGPEFNPLLPAEPKLETSLDERDPGGMGIFLARSFFRKFFYRREMDKNILALWIDPA
jgi:serine/threonine-protein kinase RsbW